jgi:membrane protease YdiL (CAAX protease family)
MRPQPRRRRFSRHITLYQKLREGTHGGRRRPDQKPDLRRGSLNLLSFQLFSGPIAEEMGWRGFALPRLQAKYNALVSSLILGIIWTFWHLPLFFMTGATQVSIPMPIYLMLVVTVTIYLTWLYNNTRGSLIITILAHFAYNLSSTLIAGVVSLMPAMTFCITAGPLLLLCTVAVAIIYGPKYLSKKPATELPFHKD